MLEMLDSNHCDETSAEELLEKHSLDLHGTRSADLASIAVVQILTVEVIPNSYEVPDSLVPLELE